MPAELAPPERTWVRVGQVRRPHGRRGALLVALDEPGRLRHPWTRFYTIGPAGEIQTFHVRRVRPHGRGVLVEVEEMESWEAADTLRGAVLYVTSEERVPLEADEYYNEDLLGCAVIDIRLGPIGTVVDVYDLGYQHLLALRGRTGRRILVPFRKVFVTAVDVTAKVIHVDLPKGWLELYEGS
ncbi:MAG: ribosome maturation factor RimM [Acidobacteria bacterium]|nr:ribosome maturation factor RimM [Acidobacteriota bacterium]MDW7984300.1 ribosome maturation factor RimM [Acidobacteriota bacterium]